MCLEIWAESARNPVFAAMCAEFEQDLVRRLTEVLQKAQARGEVAASIDPEAAAAVILTLGNGLFVRRAIAPEFDAAREVPYVIALIGAMLKGVLPSGAARHMAEAGA
jgi:hypothetical protein